MAKTFAVSLDENGKLVFCQDVLDAANWKAGEIIQINYDEEKDVLMLVNLSNAFVIDGNSNVTIPAEMVEEASLLNGCEFTAFYEEKTDSIVLKPVSKLCALCEDEPGTLFIVKEKYVCKKCQEKMAEYKTA